MITIRRVIAGLNVTVKGKTSLFLSQLEKELSIYPPAHATPHILINFGQLNVERPLSKNPSIHNEYEDGFSANFGQAIVRWYWGRNSVEVDLYPTSHEKNWYYKIGGRQYTHPYEQIGQIFHELVFIPTLQLFFHKRFLLLHGSAVSTKESNKAIIFGGTGGVGKTSLALSLVGNEFNFMADDISIVDSEGSVWANFSWPKIYGYNTLNDEDIKRRIFCDRNIIDRLTWAFRMKYMGHTKVRRRVNPSTFFKKAITHTSNLKQYYILYRDTCDKIEYNAIKKTKAIDISQYIMSAEYTILYQHLYWHQFNRESLNKEPLVTSDIIFQSWRKLGIETLSGTQCYLIRVPIDHTAKNLRTDFKLLDPFTDE